MTELPYHTHNRIDSPPVDATSLEFPIVDTVPTDTAPEGTIRFVNDSGVYTMQVRINNDWRSVTLT